MLKNWPGDLIERRSSRPSKHEAVVSVIIIEACMISRQYSSSGLCLVQGITSSRNLTTSDVLAIHFSLLLYAAYDSSSDITLRVPTIDQLEREVTTPTTYTAFLGGVLW